MMMMRGIRVVLREFEDADAQKEQAVTALRKRRDELKDVIDQHYQTLKQHRQAFDAAMKTWVTEMKEFRKKEKAKRLQEMQETYRWLQMAVGRVAWVCFR